MESELLVTPQNCSTLIGKRVILILSEEQQPPTMEENKNEMSEKTLAGDSPSNGELYPIAKRCFWF
jgi:hypothetical protein